MRDIPIKRIQHSSESEDHKYVARVETGDPKYKYRYFYSNAAYQAYLNGLKTSITPPSVTPTEQPNNGSTFGNMLINLGKKTNEIVDNGKKVLENTYESAKKSIDDINRYIFKGERVVKGTSVYNDVKYEDVIKDTNYTTSPTMLAKTFVENIVKGFVGMDMKPYDKIDSMDDLPKKKDKYSDEEDQAVINPDFDPDVYAYSNNCAYCTAAYELRQRGYDVEAAPVNVFTANTIDEICSWYKGSDPKSFSTIGDIGNLMEISDEEWNQKYYEACETKANSVKEELKQYGDGARGQFCLYWYGGGGHSMIWEVENNEVVIRDAQTNKVLDMAEQFTYATDGFYIRTDNLELSDRILKTVRQRF